MTVVCRCRREQHPKTYCISDETAAVVALERVSAPLGVLYVLENKYIILIICLRLLGAQCWNLLCLLKHLDSAS